MPKILPIQLCFRRFGAWTLASHSAVCFPQSTQWRCYSESKSNDQHETPQENKKDDSEAIRKAAANEKLSSLLASMKVTSTLGEANGTKMNLNLAKPKARIYKPKPKKEEPQEVPKEKIVVEPEIDFKLVRAAKDVANNLAGDPERTESELLQRLKASASESAMVKSLRGDKPASNYSALFVGMKIDRSKPKTTGSEKMVAPETQFRDREGLLQSYSRIPRRAIRDKPSALGLGPKVGIYTADALDIFQIKEQKQMDDTVETKTWNALEERELSLLVTQPAANAYEEMIQWTEKGRLWTFPIDNEIGLEEESQIPFHEHIMLEPLLEGFPEQGPIRHFMELVITGLSKNPYLTVERKREHVEWYRQYFKEKEEILKLSGLSVS